MSIIYKNGTYYGGGGGGAEITIDNELSSTSENPVQNKVIKAELDNKQDADDLMTPEDMDDVVTPLPGVANRLPRYSTEEQIVGYWIDGKPIYQKSITVSSLVTGENSISHNISNLERTIKCDGTVMRNGDNYNFYLPIVYMDNITAWSIVITGINQSSVNITVGSNFTGIYALSDLVLTLQYTKTTD